MTTGHESVSVCLAGLVVRYFTCNRKVSGSDLYEGINYLIQIVFIYSYLHTLRI